MRKSIEQLVDEAMTNLPDNNERKITAADVRDLLVSAFEALRPSYGYLYTGAAVGMHVSTNPEPLTFDLSYTTDPDEIEVFPDVGEVGRTDPGANRITIRVDMQMPTNREITIQLYKNGQPTIWKTTVGGGGVNRPVSAMLVAFVFDTEPASYTVRISADANSGQITIGNVHMLLEVIPVNSYTP